MRGKVARALRASADRSMLAALKDGRIPTEAANTPEKLEAIRKNVRRAFKRKYKEWVRNGRR